MATFGYTSTPGTAYAINSTRMYGLLSIGTPASNGTLDSITWTCFGTNGNLITVGLYNSDGGSPPSPDGQSLVGQCSELTGSKTTKSTETATASGTVNIVSGTQYFFGYNSDVGATTEYIYYDTSTETHYFKTGHTYSSTLSDPFPSTLNTAGSRKFGIYATYTESGGGGISIPVVINHLRQQGIS